MIAMNCECVRRVSEDTILMISKSLLQPFSSVQGEIPFIGN